MPPLHPIERLTLIQYDAIMRVINNALNEMSEDTFMPEYDVDDQQGYTNETLEQALKDVERIIMSSNVPF